MGLKVHMAACEGQGIDNRTTSARPQTKGGMVSQMHWRDKGKFIVPPSERYNRREQHEEALCQGVLEGTDVCAHHVGAGLGSPLERACVTNLPLLAHHERTVLGWIQVRLISAWFYPLDLPLCVQKMCFRGAASKAIP